MPMTGRKLGGHRAVAAFLLAHCAATLGACAAGEPSRCAAGAPTEVYELFFGRRIEGRPPVSDGEWEAFVAEVVTPNLPDGFTVLDGYGQWRNPAGAIARDPTKLLIVAAPSDGAARNAIDAIRRSYETRFQQRSVGMITRTACADFSG
jgi:hypothetical protein